MASRKKTEAELLPPETEDGVKVESKPIKKVVVSRVETFEAPSEDTLKENDEEFDYDYEPRKKKKTTEKEERDKLRAELTKYGVTPASDLRYSLFRYVDPNSPIAGVQAETESCGRFQITKEGLLNGDHVEKARTFGPGRYFFLVYKSNQLVSSFDARIAQSVTPQAQPGMMSMPDPTNPNVTIQMPAQAQQQYVDPLKQMRDSFKMMKEFREAMGIAEPQSQQPNPAPLTPEMQLASFALQDPDIKKKVVRGLFGSNGGESEKDLMGMLIEHAPSIIESVGRAAESFIEKWRQPYGQAQMVTPSLQNHGQIPQSTLQGIGQISEGESQTGQPAGMVQTDSAAAIAPEDALLAFVFDQCKRRVSVRIVANRILAQADWINQNAPIQSIDDFLIAFVEMPIDGALTFVENYSEVGKEVAALEWAKDWCAQLQAELKPAFENGGQQ